MQTKKKNKKNRWFILNLIVLILLISTFLTRLIFSNYAANQSYEYAIYSGQLKDTQLKNEQLTLASTELQSIDRLQKDSGRLDLVKVDKIYYLQPQGSVAINK